MARLLQSQTYSLVIVKILLESFSRLRVNALVRDVRILLVTGAFIVLATVCFPIPKAHPAEVVLTIVTLHVVAATVLLYADMTFWTLQKDFTMHHLSRFISCLSYGQRKILTSLV